MLFRLRTLVGLSFGLFVAVAFNACDGFTSKLTGEGTQTSLGPVDGVLLSLSEPQASVNLSASRSINLEVSSQNNYEGTVVLDVDRTALDLVDTRQDVTISLDDRVVEVAPGTSQTVVLTVTTKSSSPSFDLQDIQITAEPTDEGSFDTSIGMQVQVNPILELRMLGRRDLVEDRFDQPTDMSLAVHQQGVTVRFINVDMTEEHIVHGNASIPHGDRDDALDVSADGVTNSDLGIHQFVVMPDEDRVGSYYYHNFEGNGQRRFIRFNTSNEDLQTASSGRSISSLAKTQSMVKLEDEQGGEPKNCHGN